MLATDITARKHAERHVQQIYDLTPDLIGSASLEGYFKEINHAFEKLLGYTNEELRAMPFLSFVHPDDIAQTQAEAAALGSTERNVIHFVNPYRAKNGAYHWISWNAVSELATGTIYFTARNISQQKQAESALIAQERQYRQILDAIQDMILVKGPQSRIIWANEAFRSYYGMSNEQLQGIIDAPHAEPDYTQQYIIDDATVFNSGEPLNLEEPVKRYDGLERFFNTLKSPIFDENGQVVMTVGVSRDISDKKTG
jgi:PAS domain S-box-containing protein